MTFGVMIWGNKMELSTIVLTDDGQYVYTIYDAHLPTTIQKYAFMEDTLEILIQFMTLAEASVLKPEELVNTLVLPQFSSFLKDTVYMITDEEF
jgi:hypothetical protein